jgi:long-chain acyl-CoA synthetase
VKRSRSLSDRPVDVVAAADPVAAVLDAHAQGRTIALRTSGTSGGARAVVRSTDSWFSSFGHVANLLGVDERSRVWVPGPLSATMNLFAAVHTTVLGARLQTSPAGATHAVLTPSVMARTVAQGDLPSAVHVLAAGDRLSPGLHDRALGAGASLVSHYYGAAELSFVAWGHHSDDLAPFPGVEVVSRDGVLWVSSPYVCQGYDGPAGPLVRGVDGFATVGDRGVVEDGRVKVLGRGDDAVVTAGATVLVADVEAALEAASGHPVTVVGLPHADLGQVVCGVVTDDALVGPLREHSRAMLDPSQRPRRWYTVAELPLTPAGKLDRRRLRDVLLAGVAQ